MCYEDQCVDCIVIGSETWISYYKPESKQSVVITMEPQIFTTANTIQNIINNIECHGNHVGTSGGPLLEFLPEAGFINTAASDV